MKLNEEQQQVVDAETGIYKVEACAGSGKSTCLVARTLRLLQRGERQEDILTLSFTAEAAKQLRARIDDQIELAPTNRLCGNVTFHSFALSFCSKECENFPFTVISNPLATEGQCAKIGHEIAAKHGVNYKALRSWISLQKRNRIDPPIAIALAEKQAENLKLALAYKKYDESLYGSGCLDFDSLILETVKLLEARPDILDKYSYKFVMADECQDTDRLQYTLLTLLSKKHGNLLIVGDENQCQPPETKVRIWTRKPARIAKYSKCPLNHSHYFRKTTQSCKCGLQENQINEEWKNKKYEGQWTKYFDEINIENLTNQHKVLSWTRHEQRVYAKPRNIQIGKRFYQGPMFVVESNGNKTRMTPNHWAWTRFSKKAYQEQPYFVYLMYREDRGFRVGISHIKPRGAANTSVVGRARQEKADFMWILKFIKEGKAEAQIQEEILSLTYQIPESVFHSYNGVSKTNEQISRVFAAVSQEGGHKCLKEHNLLFESPFADFKNTETTFRLHGYFKTAACNLFSQYMELPTPEINGSAQIDSITVENYAGDVYSLDVTKDHTYIADGIPVGNSIYAWRGGHPELFRNITKRFPNVRTLYLPTNYRSTQRIVDYVKKTSPASELIGRLNTPNEQGAEPEISFYSMPQREAQEVVEKIIKQEGSVAVLARTNAALGLVEEFLADKCIKYYYLGDSGFYNRSEIKSALAYLQCVVGVTDTAINSCIRAPFWPSKYLKKKALLDEIKAKKGTQTAYQFLSSSQNRAVQEFVQFIRVRMALYREFSAKDAVGHMLRDLKAFEYYHEEETIDADNNPIDNLKELQRVAGKYGTLREFLDFIRRVQAASRRRTGVCLATGHAAKGKEWNHVYIIQAAEGVLPHKRSSDILEENNIFYVMCSRAEKTLHISYTGTASRFLKLGKDEIFDDL